MSQHILLNSGPSGHGWHGYESVLRCPALYAQAVMLRIPGESAALARGSLVHTGLAHHYARLRAARGEDPGGRAPEDFYSVDAAMRLVAETLGRPGREQLDLALVVVCDYLTARSTEPFRILHVEEKFSADLEYAGRVWPYTARADLVIERAGRVEIWDHKTSSSGPREVVTRYSMSGQFQGLHHFGSAIWGDRFAGVRINLLSTRQDASGHYPTHLLCPEPAPGALAAFPATVDHAGRLIEQLRAADSTGLRWPRVLTEYACSKPGGYGPCPYYTRCQWEAPP